MASNSGAVLFTCISFLFFFSLCFQVGLAQNSKNQNQFRWIHEKIRDAQAPLESVQRKIVSHYSIPTEGDAYCTVCKIIVGLIQEFLEGSRSEAEIARLSKDVCILLKIEDDNVCKAIIPEFKDEVLYVADNLAFSPDEVCGILYGDACSSVYNPYANWTVPVPGNKPPVVPPVPPKEDAPRIRILHMTDIHLDLDYEEGLTAKCGEPICCRKGNDKPRNASDGAGKWGDYRGCDLPLRTLESMFQYLETIQDKFDVVYWTGDLPAHDVWNQSRTDQLAHLDLFYKMCHQYLPNKPIFASVGNHESAPVNSYPPPFITGNRSINWLYEAFVNTWGLPPETSQDIMSGGYYTVSPYPGFRIVSINDNYFNSLNWWVLLNTTDPAGELSWLVQVLSDAEKNHEKVHILNHIPTGGGMQPWSWAFYNIINRFESTITAQFYGHSHTDHFAIFYDEKNFTRPTNILYIAGSVTPHSDLNPGFRIYTVDGNYTGSSWQVLNHVNYILNLTEANMGGEVKWKLEYNAKEAYNMKSAYATDWNDLIDRMAHNQTLFNLFYTHYKKSHVRPGECSDDSCRRGMLCDLKCARSHDAANLCRGLNVTQADMEYFRIKHTYN